MSTRIQRGMIYLNSHSLKTTVYKTVRVIIKVIKQQRYIRRQKTSKAELEQQKKRCFKYEPRISFLIPIYYTRLVYFKELMNSIENQTYKNWEICLADGGQSDPAVLKYIKNLTSKDERIRYYKLEQNDGIAENTNRALEMASGEWVALCDHDDLLAHDALYHIVKCINEDRTIDSLYTDEDMVSANGKRYYEPAVKPDFNIDYLRSCNYICHMFVTKREIAQQVRFKKEFDGAQDYDFIFRCCEKSKEIHHIPKILYHWRCHDNSTAQNPESKMYAYEAGKRVIEDELKRNNMKASVRMSDVLGCYFVDYDMDEQRNVALISTSNFDKNKIEKCDKCEMVFWLLKDEMSVEALNAVMTEEMCPEYVLLVNEQIEYLSKENLLRLLAPLQREDVCGVTGKIIDSKNRIYSVGKNNSLGEEENNFYIGWNAEEKGPGNRLYLASDINIINPVCVMFKKSIWLEVGQNMEDISKRYTNIFDKMVSERGNILYDSQIQIRIQT